MFKKYVITLFNNHLKINDVNFIKYCSTLKSGNLLDETILKERTKDMPDETIENPYTKERRECVLCKYKIMPNYKNSRLLSQFVSPFTGRIYGKHITGLCDKQQKMVEEAITISRQCGYMPYYLKNPSYLKDPKLYDPERPFRPHKY